MKHLESEPRAVKPADFDGWCDELGLFCDVEGFEALVGVLINFAPPECVRFIASQPALWMELLTRARHADMKRFQQGVQRGRGLAGSW